MHFALGPIRAKACRNLIGGEWRAAENGSEAKVTSPYTGAVIGSVALSSEADVENAVRAALEAFPVWAATPVKERVRPLERLRSLLRDNMDDLSRSAALESGKTLDEARAGIERGIEVMDFATSIPNLDAGGALEVSRGVTCEYRREPLGVVAGITPFNFPAMVPMWMFPIALTLGNAFVLKPSEKVPLTTTRIGELALEAGYAPGIFSIVHGDRRAVEALVSHPDVRAVAFVGSSAVAEAVYRRATSLGKRALCLGGAKNHLIVAPDAEPGITVRGVVDSFTGCAGQRCMAASVMVVVGAAVAGTTAIVSKVRDSAAALSLGSGMGALIDAASRERLVRAIDRAESEGARVILDGRKVPPPPGFEGGNWLAPTVIDGVTPDMECAKAELFGPVLSIVHVDTLDRALEFEGKNPYGNATSVFTSSGATARYVVERATSGMVGINVGVPVPRDPFSFGGTKESKFGQGDMTGPGGVALWSQLKKVTTKWAASPDATWMS